MILSMTYVFGGFLSDSRKSGVREVVLKSTSSIWYCDGGARADVMEKISLKNNSFQYEYRAVRETKQDIRENMRF